jgi:hypothetical protein
MKKLNKKNCKEKERSYRVEEEKTRVCIGCE